jgi:hypothetical protein
MGPQDPKDVTRDTARDLSGLVVVAAELRYSGGVHSVPPFSVGQVPGYISSTRGAILFVSRHGIQRPKQKASKTNTTHDSTSLYVLWIT